MRYRGLAPLVRPSAATQKSLAKNNAASCFVCLSAYCRSQRIWSSRDMRSPLVPLDGPRQSHDENLARASPFQDSATFLHGAARSVHVVDQQYVFAVHRAIGIDGESAAHVFTPFILG